MDFNEYLEKLEVRFERFFTIEKMVSVGDIPVDFYAEFHEINGRTLLTKVDVIDKYETFEKCYVKHYTQCTKEDIQKYFDFLIDLCENLEPSSFHMYTNIDGVMVFDEFDPALEEFVKELKHSRLYKYYFRGWCDVKLICVDLKSLHIYTNKVARGDKKIYKVKV